jgi:chromosomal replication initiation ATPase DnaA
MLNNQLFFDLDTPIKYNIDDIIVRDFNKNVVNFLFHNNNWVVNFIYIYGAKGVGKSFISSVFLKYNKGVYIPEHLLKNISFIEEIILQYDVFLLDDIEKFIHYNQNEFFELYNIMQSYNKKLILVANSHINDLDISLKDLKSRLDSFVPLEIQLPSDDDLKVIIFKMISDKQLNINLDVIDYLIARSKRDLSTLSEVINNINNLSMIKKRKITINLLKDLNL